MTAIIKDSKFKLNGKALNMTFTPEPSRRKSGGNKEQPQSRAEAMGEHHKLLTHGPLSRKTQLNPFSSQLLGHRVSSMKRSLREPRERIHEFASSPSKTHTFSKKESFLAPTR